MDIHDRIVGESIINYIFMTRCLNMLLFSIVGILPSDLGAVNDLEPISQMIFFHIFECVEY